MDDRLSLPLRPCLQNTPRKVPKPLGVSENWGDTKISINLRKLGLTIVFLGHPIFRPIHIMMRKRKRLGIQTLKVGGSLGAPDHLEHHGIT